MRLCGAVGKCVALLLQFTLVVACSASGANTPTSSPTTRPTQPPTPSTSPASSMTPAFTQSPTETPSPIPPTATLVPEQATWFDAETMALVIKGSNEMADLYTLGRDGSMQLIYADVGNEVRVSPDGRWLGFVRWDRDGRAALVLHEAQSSESRKITPETTSGMLRFAFDPASRRLVYLDLGAPGEGGVPWALVVVDLESDQVARYDAFMTGPETRSFPGVPVGWSGAEAVDDELIIDTFLPYSEGGWMGVWGVALPAQGVSASLDALARRELIPGTPVYSSRLYLGPERRSVAFLARDVDYFPDNYYPEFFDLAVNRLEIAALNDGTRTILVEASDGSALARALAWSPTGERLLFAQGYYEGESFVELSLKSVERGGSIVEYGPLRLPPLGGLLDLAWCDASQALYVTWDGSDGKRHLLGFDLDTAVSTELDAGERIELVSCVPQ